MLELVAACSTFAPGDFFVFTLMAEWMLVRLEWTEWMFVRFPDGFLMRIPPLLILPLSCVEEFEDPNHSYACKQIRDI